MKRAELKRALVLSLLGLACACGGRAIDGDRAVDPAEAPLGTLDQLVRTLLDDVSARPAGDRQFTRYLLLTRHSSAVATSGEPAPSEGIETELARDRLAANKLANSLSTQAEVALLQPVDELVLRVDLRDYGWQNPIEVAGQALDDAWSALAMRAALSFELEGPLAARLKSLTGSARPLLFARDFIASAGDGELYYGVLGIPDGLDALQRRLTSGSLTREADGEARTRSYRAGVSTAAGSLAPRGIERRVLPGDAAQGYWQAFDFLSRARGDSLFAAPLDFTPDATQAIFTLPNGLPAYFMADAEGRRVAEYPVAAVLDLGQRDLVQRNAASCMGCHDGRAIPVEDQVRARYLEAAIAGSPAERQQVLETYAGDAVLQELVTAANRGYGAALARVGQAPEEPDPVSAIEREARLGALPADIAAGQLFVAPEELSAALGTLAPDVVDAVTPEGQWVSPYAYRQAYQQLLCGLQRDARNPPVGCR